MEELKKRSCEPCRSGAHAMSDGEIETFKPAVSNWEILDMDGVKRLVRMFKFKNFKEALDFTVQVGTVAEQEGHHPSILTEWGKVTVSWWTHSIGGLHANDFIMAVKTDALY